MRCRARRLTDPRAVLVGHLDLSGCDERRHGRRAPGARHAHDHEGEGGGARGRHLFINRARQRRPKHITEPNLTQA